MIYLHEKQISEKLVRHWANEIAESGTEDYEQATYQIKQKETGAVYDEAIDIIPCAYTYEVTDEKIELIQGGKN